jgi:hypothetical protein
MTPPEWEHLYVPIRDYFERLVEERERFIDARLDAMDKLREFRDTQESEIVRWREHVTHTLPTLDKRLSVLENRFQLWAAVVLALVATVQFAAHWLFK